MTYEDIQEVIPSISVACLYHAYGKLDRLFKLGMEEATDDFDVSDCFQILKAVSQEVCPTVVSMVFDVTEMTVYWCEQRQWDQVQNKKFH